MSYQVTVSGGFRLEPPVGDVGRAAVAAANRGWRISPDGSLLYLPTGEEHPSPFEGLRTLLAKVLPDITTVAEAELKWTGEDGSEGIVRISGSEVEVVEEPAQELSAAEMKRLLRELASGSEAEQLEALEVCESLDLSSSQIIEAMARTLKAGSARVRTRSANALACFGSASLPALGDLIAALDDTEPWVQAAAAEALGAIGSGAAPALPALTQLQKHPSYGPAGRATEAISRIRGGA